MSVAGHLTIFQTRTRGPWWSIRPARILLAAVVGTQIVATLICVFGFLVAPLWWGWAAMVWGYALVWFLVTDPVKLLAYRVLDVPAATTTTLAEIETKPEPGAESGPVTKAASQAEYEAVPKAELETKVAPEPDAKAEPKDDARLKAKAGPDTNAAADPGLGAKADANAGSQTEVKAEPEPVSRSDIAALLKMPLGDVLMAGLLENPDEAGRLIAQSITQTEARIVTENTLEAAPEPKPDAKTLPALTPKAAE
jgi:H+-transporting ATPase